jgi:hypothetical protein
LFRTGRAHNTVNRRSTEKSGLPGGVTWRREVFPSLQRACGLPNALSPTSAIHETEKGRADSTAFFFIEFLRPRSREPDRMRFA